ncbi:hypothetical protein ACIQCM_05470 [Pseudarthrobacter sp. NPDC092439]|uniref:hypothetical protein n=1 Tax=unclassified Pseudarthrobacter TaxID=2647000 RepID=UPI0037FEDB79
MSTVKAPTINHRISNHVNLEESARTGIPVTGLCGVSFVIRWQKPGAVVAKTDGIAYRCFTCEYRFEALKAGVSIPTGGEAEAPVWNGWEIHDFGALITQAAYGEIIAVDDLPAGTLGEWSWVRRGRGGKPEIVLNVSRTAHTKHHGDWPREEQLAHMMLHIEEGSQCAGADPQHWGANERQLDTRAMQRMGRESCRSHSIWDEGSRRMVPWELEAQRTTSHVAKSELRRRSTVPASVGAPKGRR